MQKETLNAATLLKPVSSCSGQRLLVIDPCRERTAEFTMKPVVAEEGWNFSSERVAKEELEACLIYEFARESLAVERVVSLWREHFREAAEWQRTRCTPFDPQGGKQRLIWQESQKLRPGVNFPFGGDGFDGFLVQGFALLDLDKQPWQSLSAPQRKEITRRFRRNPAVRVGVLEYDFGLLHNAFKEGPPEPEGEFFDFTPVSHVDERGCERLVLVIEWAGYDEAAIKMQFARLLDGRRPKGVRPAVVTGKGKGRASELRDKLNCLGAARLRAKYTAGELFYRYRPGWCAGSLWWFGERELDAGERCDRGGDSDRTDQGGEEPHCRTTPWPSSSAAKVVP